MWVPAGEFAEGQKKVDGACVGVAYTWVVHGHTAGNIQDKVPFLRINDVPLLCLGLPNYCYKFPSWLMENCAVGQWGRTLRAPTLCCAADGGSVKGSFPCIQCARSTAPHNVPAMCPDRFPISGGYPAHGAVIHLGMIPKRRAHQHFMKSTIFRLGIQCACSTAPHNVPAMCPGRFPISGGYTVPSAVLHLGMILKRTSKSAFSHSIVVDAVPWGHVHRRFFLIV
jgi:hypothetical protein